MNFRTYEGGWDESRTSSTSGGHGASITKPSSTDDWPGLPRIETIMRRGPILHAGPMAPDSDVLSLNLAAGCVHRCGFCSARAHPTAPGNDVIYLYGNMAERLEAELAARVHLPRAVYVSPATDPFPPLAAMQAMTAEVIEVLARHGVETWLMTRGFIRPAVREVLARHADQVKVTVALTTIDRSLQRLLEPLTAPPRLPAPDQGTPEAGHRGSGCRGAAVARVDGYPRQPGRGPGGTGGGRHSAGDRRLSVFAPRIQENLVRALEPQGCDQQVLTHLRAAPSCKPRILPPHAIYPRPAVSVAMRR